MKFVDIKGTQEILSVTINFPEVLTGYKYFYPDGLTKGIFKKKTYFVMRTCWYGKDELFLSPEEAIKGRENSYFIKDGKIWKKGSVLITLRSQSEDELIFNFTEEKKLSDYLENLYNLGVDFNSLRCLETPEIISLYEFKTNRD